MDIQKNDDNTKQEILKKEKVIIEEIKSIYDCEVYNGHDLDIF